MTSNVGGIDRILRIAIGLVLIALAATGTVGWWGWLGIVPLPAVCAVRLQYLRGQEQGLKPPRPASRAQRGTNLRSGPPGLHLRSAA
jgi:hypothetical protein